MCIFVPAPVGLQSDWASMNELDSLRQEAETLKNAIRVSIILLTHFRWYTWVCCILCGVCVVQYNLYDTI